MLHRKKRPARLTKVPTRFVLFALVIFAGVLSMAYGYFQNVTVVLHAGLGVTLLGSFNAVIQLVANPGSPRFMRH